MTLTPAQWRIAMAMPEDRGPDSLEAHVIRLMDDLGLWGYHPRNSIGSRRGWPDWVILGPRGALFRELKSEHGTLTADQRYVGRLLTAAGQDFAVWRPADLLDGTVAKQLVAVSRAEVAAFMTADIERITG